MQRFAPANVTLGLHWHPYSDNIMPPILDQPDLVPVKGAHILVYLPFEDQAGVTRLLQRFPGQQFVQYSAAISDSICANVLRRRASIKHFKQHLATCSAVICNNGFELISECLQWGKPILTRPLAGQVEQLSNALALQQLGYATVMESLSEAALARWLRGPTNAPRIRFPDVADTLARWLAAGAAASPASLAERLWECSDHIAVPPRETTLDSLRVCGP